ncbi:hypothetical protein KKC45_01510 [Patescibacteria group bacterium]|nr:hypothetical protein [Patescibacteria group bacterium]
MFLILTIFSREVKRLILAGVEPLTHKKNPHGFLAGFSFFRPLRNYRFLMGGKLKVKKYRERRFF